MLIIPAGFGAIYGVRYLNDYYKENIRKNIISTDKTGRQKPADKKKPLIKKENTVATRKLVTKQAQRTVQANRVQRTIPRIRTQSTVPKNPVQNTITESRAPDYQAKVPPPPSYDETAVTKAIPGKLYLPPKRKIYQEAPSAASKDDTQQDNQNINLAQQNTKAVFVSKAQKPKPLGKESVSGEVKAPVPAMASIAGFLKSREKTPAPEYIPKRPGIGYIPSPEFESEYDSLLKENKFASFIPEKSLKVTSEKKDFAITKEELKFKAEMEKSAGISRLVSKLKKSMASADRGSTQNLFNKLSEIKGKDSNYVLKLKAFWHIGKKEYAPADMLLKQVLTSNKDDLEAGINMAVVEIKTGRVQQAKDRLVKLRKIYPENTIISDFILKLQ